MDPLQGQRLVKDVQTAQKATNKAVERFETSQISYKKEVTTVFEKMSIFSAGIISLSITFLTTLIPENKDLLTENTLKIPTYIFLYVSWILLTLNLIVGLAIRWFDSLYNFFSAQLNWQKKRKELEKTNLQFNQRYPNIVFSQNSNRENEVAIGEKNIKTLTNFLIPETQKKETFYFKTGRIFQKIAVIFFVLGLLSLLFFIIKITNGLIYK